MRTIEERFALATRHLSREATYLAGISGGRDSVVLLHLLQAEKFKNICVCHLDHGIRKEGALRDLQFTKQLSEISHMRFISDKVEELKRETASLEADLRASRFEFFGRCATKMNAAGVFLGHHADDLAETLLWNLLRGSGSQGLGGIQADTCLRTKSGAIRIFRPMLEIWRSEIDDYVQSHSLAFVEDETNLSGDFTRNRLRHEVIPWLEKTLGRNIRQNLQRTATIFQEENLWMESLAVVENWSAPLSVAWLLERPIALQRRVILRWLRHHEVAEAGFGEVELVRSLLDIAEGPARVNLARDRQARRREGKIILARQRD